MPLMEVDLRPGREPEHKKALVDAIAEILSDAMGVNAAGVHVLSRENPAENHSGQRPSSSRMLCPDRIACFARSGSEGGTPA